MSGVGVSASKISGLANLATQFRRNFEGKPNQNSHCALIFVEPAQDPFRAKRRHRAGAPCIKGSFLK